VKELLLTRTNDFIGAINKHKKQMVPTRNADFIERKSMQWYHQRSTLAVLQQVASKNGTVGIISSFLFPVMCQNITGCGGG